MDAFQGSNELDLGQSVDAIMRRGGAQAIRVFLNFRMNCVGCPIAAFHRIEDSCREHGVDPDTFRSALQHALA